MWTSIATGWHLRPLTPVPAGLGPLADAGVPATVPGCVHTDLLAAGLIPSPFDGDNEAHLSWVGRTVWQYTTTFTWADDGADQHTLVARGLDTVAELVLDGRVIGTAENQHRTHRFALPDLAPGQHTLSITFAAPVTEGEERDARYGALPRNYPHAYNMLRKSAANFGWDWGVDVATAGIWQEIGIEGWSGARLAAVRPLVDVDGSTGVLRVHVDIERAPGSTGPVEVVAEVDGRSATAVVPEGGTRGLVEVRVPDVRLWWPRGYGAQPLYDVVVRPGSPHPDGSARPGGVAGKDHGAGPDGAARPDDGAPERWTGRVGFRTVRLDTTPDAEGTPFHLLVNGRLVRVRGANWIPDHAFVTEMTRDRYERRVRDATDAHMNLLRVWGGGLYESEHLYDLCDEAGVLVWQDFLFACACYPEDDWLAREVEAEARVAVTRLAAHPSLVLWNGNNENTWGHVDWGWQEELDGRAWGDGYYHDLLPRVVAELDPTRPYTPASPYSFRAGAHPNDADHGTMHIWDVWNTRDYSTYRDHRPRFVSEFGFQGPPAWTTLTSVVHDDPLDPYGPHMLVHQKAADGNGKLERGLAGHLPTPTTIEDWHWATQLNQAHAVRYGIEHLRSLAPRCTGVVMWQLNDSWPVISWAAVDFHEHRKPLWFALRAAYAPRLVTVQPRDAGLSVVLVEDTGEPWAGTVTARRTTFDGRELARAELAARVDGHGQQTLLLPADLAHAADPAREVLVVDVPGYGRAVWDYAEVADQALDREPVSVTVRAVAGGVELDVHAHTYVRDLTLHVDRVDPGARVDAGMVTLLAGQDVTIGVRTSRPDGAFAAWPVLRHAGDLGAARVG